MLAIAFAAAAAPTHVRYARASKYSLCANDAMIKIQAVWYGTVDPHKTSTCDLSLPYMYVRVKFGTAVGARALESDVCLPAV